MDFTMLIVISNKINIVPEPAQNLYNVSCSILGVPRVCAWYGRCKEIVNAPPENKQSRREAGFNSC